MAAQPVTRVLDVAPGEGISLAGITAHVRLGPGRPGVLAIQVEAAEEYQERLRIVRGDVPPVDGIGRLAVREVPPPAAGGSAEPSWDPEASPDARCQVAEWAASRIGGVSVAVPPGCLVLLQECGSVDVTVDGEVLEATVTGSGSIKLRGTHDLVLTVAGGGAALLSDVGGTARITASGAAAVELSGRLEQLQIVASDQALVRGRGDFHEVGGAVAGRGRIDLDGHVQRVAVDVFGGGSLSVNGRRVR